MPSSVFWYFVHIGDQIYVESKFREWFLRDAQGFFQLESSLIESDWVLLQYFVDTRLVPLDVSLVCFLLQIVLSLNMREIVFELWIRRNKLGFLNLELIYFSLKLPFMSAKPDLEWRAFWMEKFASSIRPTAAPPFVAAYLTS